MMTSIAEVVALVLVGASAGTLLGVSWAIRAFPERLWVESIQQIVRVFKKEIPPVFIASFASAVVVAVLRRSDPAGLALALAAAAGMLAVMVITVRGNVPINDRLETWNAAALPSDAPALVARWKAFNRARVVVGVIAFVCLALPV